MALDLLGIPATSTPSERAFSRAGDIFTAHRKRIIGETAQALLNVGSWWSIQGLSGPNHPIIKHPKIDARNTYVNMPLVQLSTKWGTLSQDEHVLEVEEALEKAGGDEDVVEEELELIPLEEEENEELAESDDVIPVEEEDVYEMEALESVEIS